MNFNGFVYIANGFGDQAAMRESQLFTRLMKAHSVERNMTYTFEVNEQESNATVFSSTLKKGLTQLFADTQATTMMPYGGMEGWHAKKEALIKKYGYDPMQLSVSPIPFSQQLLAMNPKSATEVEAFFTTIKATSGDKYDFSAVHFSSLAAYWKSQNKPDLASAVLNLNRKKGGTPNAYDGTKPALEQGLVSYISFDGKDDFKDQQDGKLSKDAKKRKILCV